MTQELSDWADDKCGQGRVPPTKQRRADTADRLVTGFLIRRWTLWKELWTVLKTIYIFSRTGEARAGSINTLVTEPILLNG